MSAAFEIARSKWHKARTRVLGSLGNTAHDELADHKIRHSRVLRENADRYRAIVDTAVDAIIVADRFGKIESFNRAAEMIFGYAAEEIIGRNIRELTPEPNQSGHDGFMGADRATGERKIIGIGREVMGKRKNGTTVPLELSIAEWHDADGYQCFTGIMRDVTLRNQQERDLQNAKEAAEHAQEVAERAQLEAEAANHAKTEFLAMMSHEIRTPLTSISGFVDLLSQTGKLTREQRRFVELVRTANDALLTIVNDILDFSKVEAGQLELEIAPFSATTLVHHTVGIVHPIAAQKKLTVKFMIERDVPEWLYGDDARLRQVLLNLMNNAVKFTQAGSIEVNVSRVQGDPDKILFSVTDTGIGIPAEQQGRLFKQFSQADSSVNRRHGGTGLGLAICKRLVELMSGKIGLVSDVGKGTTLWFTATLPAAAEPQVEPDRMRPANHPGESKARILLVDDLDTNQEIVKAYLEDNGHEVDAVGSAVEAIGLVQKRDYDLVLMDIQMPVMDGVTATRRIRALPAPAGRIPIIALSGNVLPQQVCSFLEAGMNDHIGKPIERAKLYETVWRWVDASAKAAEHAHESRDPSRFDRARFDELVQVLGVAKTEMMAHRFVDQLSSSFKSTPDISRQEAHALINGAGVLGFGGLVDLCREIELAPRSAERELGARLTEMRAARKSVLTLLEKELLPDIRGAALRRAG
jgi:PAS domain S-box-containing protein